MAASTLALILPSCKFALTQESPSSRPSCGLTWSLHFLGVLLSTAKAPTSPPFPFPSLVLSQVLSSLLHQVLTKRAGHGLPSLELLCRGSGTSLAEGPQLPGASNITGVRGSCKFTLSQEEEHRIRAIPWAHPEPSFPDDPFLDSHGSHEPILPVLLPHPCPRWEEKSKKGQRQLLLGRTTLWFQQEEVLNCSRKI